MNRLAIFDCDGTLVDSGGAICLAMESCFADAALVPPTRARTRAVVGLSLPQAMAALLPDRDETLHRGLAESYKAAFGRLRNAGLLAEPLFPGIPALLDALEADGWLLGVATGKSDRGLRLCLAAHGLAKRFITVQTADRHPSKPHPAMVEAAMADAGATPETSVVIGDTSYDMAMAQAAGVRAIGVGWGYHAAAELLAAGAEAVAADAGDLLHHLRVPA